MKMRKLALLLILLPIVLLANTPGKHSIALSWTASTTPGVTYNLYRGTATGVCLGTPTPYVTSISSTSFTDTGVTGGTTYFYAVSAVGIGGESTCSNEVQIAVPSITTLPPSSLSGTVN